MQCSAQLSQILLEWAKNLPESSKSALENSNTSISIGMSSPTFSSNAVQEKDRVASLVLGHKSSYSNPVMPQFQMPVQPMGKDILLLVEITDV